MEQIRYLKQEEKQKTRQMYENIFEEDSKEFVDYYYQWKIKDNQIIVMEDRSDYEVMMHLNPYMISFQGKEVTIPYIVAVATRPDARRKGKMLQVMKQALKDMQKAHCPFTFLLPANPAYYQGQGFVFTRVVPKTASSLTAAAVEMMGESKEEPEAERKKGQQEDKVEWKYLSLNGADKQQLWQTVETANMILAMKYDVYVKRDSSYYERLLKEVKSEQGKVLIIKVQEQLIGVLVYGAGEQAEIKEILLSASYEEKRKEICDRIFGATGWKEEKMRMMFRITDLQSLSGMLKGAKKVLTAAVTDDIIAENNGIFRIEWNPQGGKVVRVEKKQESVVQHLDISEVTEKIMENLSIFIQEWI